MIFLAVPLATIGGILYLYLRGMPFSISAGVGFIVLFGVAILNGLVLINRLNALKSEGITDIYERIQIATKERLRPILLTATSAIMGFTPMAFSSSAGAEVQRPLATVVIGGLISATFLTLIIVPVLYALIEKNSLKLPAKITAIIIFTTIFAQAQEVNSLEQAINIGLKQNVEIKIADNKIILQTENKKTAFTLPKTQLSFQYGQYNSFYNDLGFSIEQSFHFPTYYKNSKRLAETKIYEARQQKGFVQTQLKLLIKNAWNELSYNHNLLRFYQKQDSLYSGFLKAAELRYQTGEANYLEKITAETKLKEVQNKITQIQADINKNTELLRMLLNDSTKNLSFNPPENFKRTFSYELNQSVENHPLTKIAEAQILSAKYKTEILKSQMLPEFSIGYFNISMIGNETKSGKPATSGDRFMGIQGGVSFPVFLKPYKAQVNSSKINVSIQQLNKYHTELQLKTKLQQQLQEIEKQMNNLNYYENYALKQSQEIINTAYKSYVAGEISYIDYFNLLQQAFEIQLNYYESIFNYNISVNQFEFLINK